MDSIEKRLDYLTKQVKDLQDKECNCCEGEGECNCGEEIGEIIQTVQELESSIKELEASSQECCNTAAQELAKLKKALEELEDKQAQDLSNVPGVRESGNILSPIPVNPTVGKEYSYGGDVYYQRYEIELTGSYKQQFSRAFPAGFNKVVKIECAGVDRGGVLFLDGLQTLSNELSASGEKVSFQLRALLGGSPTLNLSSQSDTSPSVETFSNEKVLVDLYYTKLT